MGGGGTTGFPWGVRCDTLGAMPSPNPPPAEPPPLQPPPPLVGRLAIAFVFLALAALVVVPLLVQWEADRMRARIDRLADPARTQVARVQYALSREMAALHGHVEMGEPGALERFAEARRLEEAALDSLRAYARALGPAVLEPYVRLETLAHEWDGRTSVEALRAGGAATPDASRRREMLEEAVRTADRVDAAILREARASRAAIRRTEQVGRGITLLLGALAALAAGTVVWLYRRMRGVARLAERRRTEAERALRAREHAIEARARLLRGVTHDVKNPLGAAHGYAELLEMGVKGPLTPEQGRYVAGIRRSIDGALAILADLLDLARADGGGLRVDRIPLDLSAVVSEAVEEHRSAAEAAGHALDFAGREPVRLYTDPDRVRQVLANLLSNAVKYTPAPGQITVTTAQAEDGGPRPGHWAAVHVADSGPGIAEEHREAIFEEFRRLHDGTGTPGHGLGLAIARRVAELLGGALTVDDAPGGGARFTLWLPLRDPDGADEG